MDFLATLHASLPWYLQVTGSPHLHEWIVEWGANRGIVRGDDWTRVFGWLYKWLAVGALAWGVGTALLVTKRSERGRFKGDPGKFVDAAVSGALRTAVGAALAAALVLVLFLLTAVGPGPFVWLGIGYGLVVACLRVRRALTRREQERSAPREVGSFTEKRVVA